MRVVTMIRGLVLSAFVGLVGCTGGGSGALAGGGFLGFGTAAADGGCIGFCGDAGVSLTQAEVGQIIAQAVFEAQARGLTRATIAVSDRVGNVLGVFELGADNGTGVPSGTVTITSGLGAGRPFTNATLDGAALTNAAAGINATGLAAVSKAITAAYLSSEGNAFTTRTANQIVQENFNPGESSQPGGPLFGVQFSQLGCSDLTSILAQANAAGNIAPRASPFGLAADPGGIPLYKGGVPVGGIGVLSDGVYGIDRNLFDLDINGVVSNDEAIALAGTTGFQAPADRRADRITVDGKLFRFTDVENFDLRSIPANAPTFAAINGVSGQLVDTGVTGVPQAFYIGGALVTGQAFGQATSGVQSAAAANAFPGQAQFAARDAFVLTDGAGVNTYPPIAGAVLTQAQVQQLMLSALDVANSTRAQIRRPVNSQMRATISVVDTDGTILGIVRTRDGPMFGTDVSLQKARTAMFFSQNNAGALITAGAVQQNSLTGTNQLSANAFIRRVNLVQGIAAVQDHTPVGAAALANGIAFADRSGGNLSRPSFPDGVQGRQPGPLSHPIATWSPFATGFQFDLVYEELLEILFGAVAGNKNLGQTANDNCNAFNGIAGLQNGIQIFPGSVPIYNAAGALIGGIGVSGDGIDQDDMTSFLGTHNAGVLLGGAVGNAPAGIRADTVFVQPRTSGGTATGGSVNLRYIQCPQAPFLNSSQQDPCNGK